MCSDRQVIDLVGIKYPIIHAQGRGDEGGPRRKRFSEACGRGSLRENLNLRLITYADADVALGATPELMWCRYRGSRFDPFADNAFLVFFARPVLIVHERVFESPFKPDN